MEGSLVDETGSTLFDGGQDENTQPAREDAQEAVLEPELAAHAEPEVEQEPEHEPGDAGAPTHAGASDPADDTPTITIAHEPRDNSLGPSPASAAAQDAIPHPADPLADEPLLDEPPATPPPVVPPYRVPAGRTPEQVRRWHRRRRRYTLYMRRSVRARQAARSATIARAAWVTTIAMVGLIITVLAASVATAASYYTSEAGLIQNMQRGIAAKDSVRIYDSKGTLLYQFDDYGAQHSIQLAQVPVAVINATVAIEDHDFWTNDGVDFVSIVRAAQEDLQTGHIQQGGSTITQQLIKGQILGGEVSFQRKLNEAILSVGLTTSGAYTKSQILEMYLNSIPYSPTAYGIDAAAQEYFDYQDDPSTGTTAAQHLDLAQATMLAGIPQNPNLNDPLLHPEHARSRQALVLHAMVQYGYITQAQADAAWQEAGQPGFFHPVTTEQNKAPHFVYFVINQLKEMIDTGQLHNLSRSGLNIYTTLDLDMQNQVQQYMKNHLYGNDRDDYGGGLICNDHLTNSAAILVDHHTGAIRVLLGSVDYYSTTIDGQFDDATQAFRGPGSAFKPIAYATAFEKGWFPALTVSDTPTAFWDAGAGVLYKPLDFNSYQFKGEVTLRHALQDSLNIPAVKVMQYAGIDNVRTNAERMGVTQWAPGATWGLSSVLGSLDVTLYEMVQAYTVFANYGYYIPLHAIDQITDSAGNVLFQYHVPTPVPVLDPRIAFMVTSVLSDNPTRADDFGGCSPLYLDPSKSDCYYYHYNSPNAWPAAAKTGTGQDFTDDWTLGYTTDYTMGVWAGNNDHTPMYHIDGITGSAPIWYNSMIYAEQSHNLPKTPFPVPPGVQQARYCSQNICTTDWFLDGPLPPQNIGEQGGYLPCIFEPDSGGWVYSSPPNCQGAIVK
jgi:membrane peptidoglycan carboxypeptidase